MASPGQGPFGWIRDLSRLDHRWRRRLCEGRSGAMDSITRPLSMIHISGIALSASSFAARGWRHAGGAVAEDRSAVAAPPM
jgi:hypothetical protein